MGTSYDRAMAEGGGGVATRRLLLLSNSQNAGSDVLEHATAWLRSVLRRGDRVAIVPFARPAGADEPVAQAAEAFRRLDVEPLVVERTGEAPTQLAAADAVFVMGGNTFPLLRDLRRFALDVALRS